MKIKEVSAGVKVSRNYNSYSVNLVADLENGESPENVGGILIEKAKEVLSKKMNELGVVKKENLNKNEKEVGAAWFSKDSKEKLSVQYSKGSDWVDVEIKNLEKTNEGYRQKINGENFIFRRIPDEKRKNNKMPNYRIYRIYKIEGTFINNE